MIFFHSLFSVENGTSHSQKLRKRSEIEAEYKWKTTDIFASDKAWEKNYSKLESMLSELDTFPETLHESASRLLECLKTRDKINILLDKLSLYANLKSDEDTRISTYQAFRDRIAGLTVKIHHRQSFIHPEILGMPQERLQEFIKSNTELKEYRHYLEDLLRSKAHILSQEGEQLLALSHDMGRSPYQIFSMFNNADIRFPEVVDREGRKTELTKGNFLVFMKSPDRNVREDAFMAMYRTYNQWNNTLAASLSGSVKRDIFYARARHYKSAREAALDADNIPLSVYDNLITAVHQNMEPMHRYITLRKQILAVEKVAPWDLYVPLLQEYKWEVSYKEAVETLGKALEPLGPDYVKIMETGFASGWFDVFENPGKRSGAYSTSAYGVSHPFMLLNYQGMLDDMFTISHEMGHSMHSYFTLRTQPYIYGDYTIFVAEVASTLNEALMMDYLLKNTSDPQKKLYLLNQYVDQIRGTLYIQTIFAEFEKTVHEIAEAGDALTSDVYNQITRELYTSYYGPDFEMDPLFEINWSRIPHFYYNFYVYQYATGISAATSLAQNILAGDLKTRDAYLNFLKQGSSDYSINLLKKAGVDMTSPSPVEETTKLFNNLLMEMESLLL